LQHGFFGGSSGDANSLVGIEQKNAVLSHNAHHHDHSHEGGNVEQQENNERSPASESLVCVALAQILMHGVICDKAGTARAIPLGIEERRGVIHVGQERCPALHRVLSCYSVLSERRPVLRLIDTRP
jgi:hypothetical protein